MDKFDTLLEKLDLLKSLDPDFEIFGAETHEYQFNPPLTEHAVQQFERQHNIILPKDYRTFLLKIGNGGAGPFYGLYRLEETITNSLPNATAEPFGLTEAWHPTAEDAIDREAYEQKAVNMLKGCLAICDFGCALEFILIVSGPERGNVWFDSISDDMGLVPLADAPTMEEQIEVSTNGAGTRLDFYNWYNFWLDASIAELQGGTKL